MKSLFGKNIHVVGFAGTEGAALLEYLHHQFPTAKITAHDYSPKELFLKHFKESHIALEKDVMKRKAEEILGYQNVSYCFRENYLEGIETADSIFVPQSWYLYEQNAALKAHQEKFRSITRLYFDLFPGKIIGVTGSNGKTTTTNLIAEIMKRAFPRTLFSGNDRRAEQVLQELKLATKDDWLVLEISNRQLMIDLGKSPDINVITNITPNHLTEYASFEEYAAVKASLLKYQTLNQWSVLNADDPESKKLMERDGGETMPFSISEVLPKGVFVQFGNIVIKHADKEEIVMPVSEFPLRGKHNLSNAVAAIAATYLAGVDIETIAQTLRSVAAIPQRMELIKTVAGVEYYNDSASTVPESTIAAIETLQESSKRLILIMGGNSKGSDYKSLGEEIMNRVKTLVFLKSPVSDEMLSHMKNFSGKIETCETLQEAVQKAHIDAQEGDSVLFSPAGEYFVYFKDKMPGYKNFRHIVESLD
jgi:UDP-N-acetylmuramoylalanine--D-glutamate ligase